MPAYRPPQQELFSPVTNFYKGKAIRQQLAAGEQEAEMRGLKIDLAKQEIADAPSKREAAKEMALLNRDNIQSQIDKRVRDGEMAELELSAKALTPLLEDYTNEEDEDKALEGWNKNISSVISLLSEKEQERIIEAAGPDKQYSHEEIMSTGLGVRLFTESGSRTAQKFIDSDGNAVQGSMDKQGNYFDSSGEQRTDITPIAPQAGQGDIDPRSGAQRGKAYQEHLDAYQSASDVQELITAGLPRILELPQAVGMKGKIAMGGAGLLSTFGQEEMAEAFSEYMSGADAETIATIQTQLQAIRARIIPIVTGEQGKRLSEMEREIASRTVGLIDEIRGPADLTKSYPQVIGALKQLYEESWATKYRTARNEPGLPYPFDLSDKGDRIELLQEFSDAGIDIDSAKRAIFRLKAIQGVQ